MGWRMHEIIHSVCFTIMVCNEKQAIEKLYFKTIEIKNQ